MKNGSDSSSKSQLYMAHYKTTSHKKHHVISKQMCHLSVSELSNLTG